MIQQQLVALQTRLQTAPNIPQSTKTELLQLLGELETEISLLAQTHSAEAQRIAAVTETTAHEATILEKKPERIEAALQELRDSVTEFETSHPKMTGVVGQLATTLSNMGI